LAKKKKRLKRRHTPWKCAACGDKANTRRSGTPVCIACLGMPAEKWDAAVDEWRRVRASA